MRKLLAFLGLFLALAAGGAPAYASPAKRAAILTPSTCAGVALSLDFAINSGSGRYCLNGTRYSGPTFIPGWSFTRASTKTALNSSGSIISFASGVPAITDLGLLIEESRTNLALQSQTFAGAAWGLVTATTADNQSVAPDGTSTAAKLTEDTTATTQHRIDQALTFSAVPYTFTVYAKPNGRNWIQLRINTNGAYFDVQNGIVGSSPSSGVTTSISKAANGFYRCSVTFTPTAGSSAVRVNLSNGDNGQTYTGDGVSGAFLWGAQLEQASFATSYIPTTSASVTRAADAATLTYSPAGSAATVTYGTSSTANPSPTSPINLGSSSGGAWVNNYVRKLAVTP